MLIKFFLFFILSSLLGNPLLALIVLLVISFAVDRAYFGFLPDPFRALKKAERIRQLRNIIEINPHDARSLKELGIFMVEQGDYKSALHYFERAAGRMADDAEFLYYYGLSLANRGDVLKGRELVDNALQKAPSLKYGEPYLMMAEVYIDNAEYANALPLLEQFEKIHFASSRGLYRMGIVQMKLGMKEEGRASLAKAVEVFKRAPRYLRKIERKWAWKARMVLLRGF